MIHTTSVSIDNLELELVRHIQLFQNSFIFKGNVFHANMTVLFKYRLPIGHLCADLGYIE